MTAWTTNPNWDTPAKTELCGRVSDRFIPCAHERPCPIHEPKLPRLTAFEPWPDSPSNQHGALAMHKRKEGP